MGDIAEAMLNGDMDCVTGEWIGDGDGYPRTFEEGQRESVSRSSVPKAPYPRMKPDRKCQHCKKSVRGEQGLKAHVKAKHPKLYNITNFTGKKI